MLRIMSYGIDTLRSIVGEYMEFSYDEKAVGKWVNGKTVYQKVVEITGPSKTGSWEIVLNVSDLNIDTLIDIYGVTDITNSNYTKCYIPINSTGNNNMTFINLMFADNNIHAIVNAGNMTNLKSNVILLYTKND